MYISQHMQQTLKIDLVLENDYFDWFLKEKEDIQDISLNALFDSKDKHYMIVAEPGYGKTRLLKEIVAQAKEKNKQAFFIDAKKIKNVSFKEIISECEYVSDFNILEEELQRKTKFKNIKNDFVNNEDTIVCIDALDEVAINSLYELLEKIENFIKTNSDIKIFLSCRTHHLKKLDFNFSIMDFKFIILSPFTGIQIKQFLENRLGKKIDLELMYKKSKMSNLIDFITIPRYLYYFSELLKDGSLDEVINMPRSDMFEHFIYRKLNKELKENTPQSQIDLLKRVLEKLAFIMKLNDVSMIGKDELMTIFDKIDSNFSQIVFRDDLIQKLYDRSLIKDNVETVEFENQEFLDYLSAKELTRFNRVEQVFFDVAFEPNILELYPTWFYVLPFVFEFKPTLIEIFIDFLDKNEERVLTAEYFKSLLSVEPEKVSKELRSKIFDTVFNYYTNHTKWLDSIRSNVSRKLARFYDNSKYQKIIDSIDGRKNSDSSLTVLRTNAVRLNSLLIEDKKLDKEKIKYWQNKVSEWLKKDVVKYRYLHSNVIEEFHNLANRDFEWIKKHRFIFETGVQVQEEYARTCYKIASNDIFSIDVYLETEKYWIKNKQDKNLARAEEEYDYILEINSVDSMKYALDKIWDNESYYCNFCENLNNGVFNEDKLLQFKKNILNICDDELLEFLKKLIAKSIEKQDYRIDHCNGIYLSLLEIVLEKDKEYIKEYANILKENCETNENLFYYSFFTYASIELVSKYFDIFEIAIGSIIDNNIRFSILRQIYYRSLEKSAIRKKLIDKYPKLIDNDNSKIIDYEKIRQEKLCKKWLEKIESEPKKFKTNLFSFFNNSKEKLKKCDNYKDTYNKTLKLVKEILKNNNPLERSKLIKKENGARLWGISYYKSCINFAYNENIDLDQDIRDNVFRYLPFNSSADYEATLVVAKTPSAKALQDVIDVYAGKRDDDLGVYNVSQFIKLYNSKKLEQFEPILLKMLENSKIEEWDKARIAMSLPTNVLTVKIIKENKKKLDQKSELYKMYLSILMQKHQDKDTIKEAFEWIKTRAKEIKTKDRFYEPHENIALGMANTNYSLEKDKELLLLSSELAEKGQENGSELLKKVVKIHLEHLIKTNSKAYEFILDIEKFLETNKDKKGLHWFEYTLQDLKKVYLGKVKKSNIAQAVKKYNELSNKDYLLVNSTYELMELIKKVIDEDIRRWIEAEGAYKHIQELAKKENKTDAEDFIQKSIKSQIELALLKKGVRNTDFIREEQMLDNKRLDFTVRYGFVGSVMIELKISHESEAKPTTKKGKNYNEKLKKYMAGSNSDYGLFVVFNIKDDAKKFNKQIRELNKLYENEDNISVMGLNCI